MWWALESGKKPAEAAEARRREEIVGERGGGRYPPC